MIELLRHCRAITSSLEFMRHVYCIGVANSVFGSEWNTVYTRYKTAAQGHQKEDLLQALTCSRNSAILKRSVAIIAY